MSKYHLGDIYLFFLMNYDGNPFSIVLYRNLSILCINNNFYCICIRVPYFVICCVYDDFIKYLEKRGYKSDRFSLHKDAFAVITCLRNIQRHCFWLLTPNICFCSEKYMFEQGFFLICGCSSYRHEVCNIVCVRREQTKGVVRFVSYLSKFYLNKRCV